MALEHFLEDWGGLKVCPFLNLSSGSKRIRIEHGHLYDPFFVRYPRLYEVATWFGGLFLKLHPSLYKIWIHFERFRGRLRVRRAKNKDILGEPPAFTQAARELSRRGFDAVVFGHTHHAGHVKLSEGADYYNSGSWLLKDNFIQIIDGEITLSEWSKVSKTKTAN